MDDAARHVQGALSQAPDLSAETFAEKEPFKNATDRDRLLEAIRRAGLPG